MKKGIIIFLSVAFFCLNIATAQQSFSLLSKESYIKVTGTSSIHDWEMNSSDIIATLSLLKEEDGIKKIEAVNLKMKAKALLSDNSTMDSKAHSALKADKNPEISFQMISCNISNTTKQEIQGTISGRLSVAGKTRQVNIPFRGNYSDSNTIGVNGIVKLKMTDFEIEPPRAMLGALKTGDDINVEFKLEFRIVN